MNYFPYILSSVIRRPRTYIRVYISVDLLLKSAGDAPILKKKKWSVDPDKKVAWIIDFLRRYLKCQPSESLVS